MKRIALFASLLAFALTPVASAKEGKKEKQQARTNAAVAKMAASKPGQVPRQFSTARQSRRSFSNGSSPSSFQGQQFRRSSNLNPDVSIRPRRERAITPRINTFEPPVATANVAPVIATNPVQQIEGGSGRRNRFGNNDRDGNGRNNETGNWRNNNNNVTGEGQGNDEGRGRHWRGRDRDWNNNHKGDGNYSQAHRRWHRRHQNRAWWRSNYTRFALFGGGYYYWNSGYWYPAYGYDPYFTTYAYDAPIYGSEDQEPGQVVASVQSELQRRGYDPGGVDGEYGPATRQALLDYQRDNDLPVTGEIDESTLDSLGLQ